MGDKLKNPNCLIDAEAASNIVPTKSVEIKPANKSGTTSSSKGSKSSKMKTSQSALKESTNKSSTSDKMSGTSISQS
jgi:hypothetical protein